MADHQDLSRKNVTLRGEVLNEYAAATAMFGTSVCVTENIASRLCTCLMPAGSIFDHTVIKRRDGWARRGNQKLEQETPEGTYTHKQC